MNRGCLRSKHMRWVSLAFLAAEVGLLLAAAPAYADDAPRPSVTTGAWVVILGGFVVIVAAGLAVAALRKAAMRRHEQEALERVRPPRATGDDIREEDES
jgi:hypothetical protein